MKYKLAYDTWGNEEIKSIQKVIKSKRFTMGANVKNFETKFAKYLGRKYAVMTNSGSSANLIGIGSQFFIKNKLKHGDEVIVPGISWSTTYSPLQQYGLKLKFVDVDINTLNIEVHKIERAISKKTRMICVVNILGFPAELIKLQSICKRKKIILFEDNCESLGSEIKGKKTGVFGDFSTHSFFFSHHISTMEGGMVVTDNYEIYCILKSLRAHGWTRDLPTKNPLYTKKKKDFYEEYKFILPGYNVRSGEINAAIGIEQLKKINTMTRNRIKNHKLFKKYFANDTRFIIQKTNYKNSAFCFSMIIKNKNKKSKLNILKKLSKNGIDFRLITGGCFTKHKYKKYFDYEIYDNLDNSIMAHKFGFFVGNSSKDLSKEILKLYETLK